LKRYRKALCLSKGGTRGDTFSGDNGQPLQKMETFKWGSETKKGEAGEVRLAGKNVGVGEQNLEKKMENKSFTIGEGNKRNGLTSLPLETDKKKVPAKFDGEEEK